MAWRHILKDKQSAILNFIGLSTGLACTVLIFIWVRDERQMDSDQYSNTYHVMENRVKSGGIWTSPTSSGPMAQALVADMPEVTHAVAVRSADGITFTVEDRNIKADGKSAGPDFFQVFNYPLLLGDKSNVLATREAIVLSDSLARRLFGSARNALGKTVDWQHRDKYTVTGIFQAPDSHHSERFDFIVSIKSMYDQPWANDWGNTGLGTYVKLKPGTNIDQFNKKMASFVKVKTNGEILHRTPFLFPYKSKYLHDHFVNGVSSGGRIDYVNLFSIIAVFILVIACINFINLSTARAGRRAKEVGIRKVAGATRSSLVIQYIGESMLVAMLSLGLALLLVMLSLPFFNSITGKNLALTFDGGLLGILLLLTIFTGLVAGSYPAIYLSGFNPGVVLKGKLGVAGGASFARKGLVVFQFTLSVVLIVAVLAVYKQIKYVQERNLGFNRENVLTIPVEGKLSDRSTQTTFLNELRRLPGVQHASALGHNLTGHWSGTSGVNWPGKDEKDKTEFENMAVDYDLVETLSMQLKEGRSFSKDFGSDTSGIMFNEAAITYMGLKDPIGKTVQLWGEPRTIIGVVKDFHYESLHKTVSPLFLRVAPDALAQFMASIAPGQEKQVIDGIKALYAKFNPGFAFEYSFLDARFKELYQSEQRVSVLSRFFAALAIIISCLGLFGLAAYTAQTRQKEIAIRKVIGASVQNIVLLLSKDFLKLILVAVVIAFPLSWWAVNSWMHGFAYRASLGYGIFLIAGISILLITLITISFQALKAALVNPSKSLKSE